MEDFAGTAPVAASPPFRALALDGGGIRGYYTTRLLEHLVERAGGDPGRADFGAAFDLIVGTSTGSLVGAALAAGFSLSRMASLYRDHGPQIFPRPAPIGWKSLLWCGRHWRRPSADAGALRAALAPLFGATTLGELYGRRGIALCVTATDIRTTRGSVLATPHPGSLHAAPDAGVAEACIASCAAPMLMPPVRVPGAGVPAAWWCDGGLWAASPVLVALEEALATAPAGRTIEIVSVGTCAMPVPAAVAAHPPGTGIGLWIRGLRAVQVSSDAQSIAIVDFARRLAPELRRTVRIVRLSDPLPNDEEAGLVRLDNAKPDAFAAMERLALAGASLNGAEAADAAPEAARVAALLHAVVAGPVVADARN
jgi:predicted acylesterase/phospholipase RssA